MKSLGADAAINYKTTDFVEAVKAATGDHGADVILDMVGGDYLMRNLDAVAEEGRVRADLHAGRRRRPTSTSAAS